ncbi:hypothetical protein HID58_017739 [Brassica napus]|uniref:Uncharacterized protein n=1 Tax=Brassica napus TaxID=3708 RepID=A0ABQ8D7Y4_BRANA|nr:hypothetical protein HID58_017739 [Brassica napus]
MSFYIAKRVRRSPLYPPIVEAPPPPYPPTRTRFQDYYSGYGQLHPPPLRPFRDEYYGEGEYEGRGLPPKNALNNTSDLSGCENGTSWAAPLTVANANTFP